MSDEINGHGKTDEGPPEKGRAYYFLPSFTPEERAIATSLGNPDDYCTMLCPQAMPAQLAQGPNGPHVMQILDPETGEPTGTGLIFLVPVVVPLEMPTSKLISGFLGPDGKPMGSAKLEGPPFAQARVLVPRKSLTDAARAELKAAEDAERARVLAGIGIRGFGPTAQVPPEPKG
jgi:hypothetical protein